MKQTFSHVTTWVFDLDHTLYPPEVALFEQIEKRMEAFICKALSVDLGTAKALRAEYWASHGTTLAGLMDRHDMPPEDFLHDVHDIDFSIIPPSPELADAICSLPGRKIIYTNGTRPYAQAVTQARGLTGVFDEIYGVEHAGYRPKPEAQAFAKVFAQDGLDPTRAAMFEDDIRNLAVPHALGLRTVHVAPQQSAAPHVHHHTDDLASFLSNVI
ncbi:pyrimidine 5'-nucleotidase [Nereida sp. MMG025]|uniref:pyrimidine 5'-nucleotidase n=1 Tax=Nereida sp. MMG025 TaxID=2909981 RepID=UPI001F245790|nr:pyrimidine 5'-nucleotidase [Nereida sp. MMG025]MCF6443778.1 pyrimidine 5'-nucleotidase [Nereida sp. MMG025]